MRTGARWRRLSHTSMVEKRWKLTAPVRDRRASSIRRRLKQCASWATTSAGSVRDRLSIFRTSSSTLSRPWAAAMPARLFARNAAKIGTSRTRKRCRRKNFAPFAIILGAKSKLCSRRWTDARQCDADFPVAHFNLEGFQIYSGRSLGDFSSAHVETRVVPWASHAELLKIAFRERAEAVRTKFLESIKISFELRDCYHLAVDFHP